MFGTSECIKTNCSYSTSKVSGPVKIPKIDFEKFKPKPKPTKTIKEGPSNHNSEAQKPMFGEDWERDFKSKYGENEVEWITKQNRNKINYSTDVYEHLTTPQGVTRTGVVGGHNQSEFFGYLDTKGIPYRVEEVIQHPSIEGIYDVKYKIGKQEKGQYLDNGEFKASTHKKTLYDSNSFSDADIKFLGKEAMETGSLITTKGGQKVIQGTAPNGLKFEGWVNPKTGEIDSYYPVLKFNNYGN